MLLPLSVSHLAHALPHCPPHSTQPLAAPTLEVFFARQPPGTGVKRHTDYVNFVQTTHLGLVVPEGDCWMKVCFLWGGGDVQSASAA